MATQWTRRTFLSGGAAALAGAAAAQDTRERPPAREPGRDTPPILFVHGEGDSAALWMPTLWRFESAFHSRSRLFAADMRLPNARRNDALREPGRSSTEEATAQLSQEIARARRTSGIDHLVVVAHGRAGNILRNYLRLNPRPPLRAAILCATPTSGTIVSDRHMTGSEYNGAGRFLRTLNAMPDGTPGGTPTFTLSGTMDKWAQPDGRFLGLPGVPTGIDPASPGLPGAPNIILQGADHLEAAYSAEAFAEIWRIVTGEPPPGFDIRPEIRPVLNGRVTGFQAGVPTNIGVAGARVRLFAVDPATASRTGPALHDRTTRADGLWGPFEADPASHYEFEITARGHPVTHLYRAPFLRGSDHVHLRPWLAGTDDPKEGALVVVSRPRGYFDFGRDRIEIAGQAIQGTPDIPHENILRVAGPATGQAMAAIHNETRLAALAWPLAERHVAVIELPE
jgi:pimeloyl-ACP methyl ester carboxylesterase